MLNLLHEYTMTPAPCGSERKIGDLIQEKLTGLDIHVDAHGSIIVHKKGSGDGIVFLCAMDTPCMYITYVDEYGFLRFSSIGDFKPQKGTLVLMENGKTGIISAEKEKPDNFFIDAGSGNTCAISEYAVPYPLFSSSGDSAFGFCIGKFALMSVLTKAALSAGEKDVYFVFAAKTSSNQMSPAFMKSIDAALLVSLEVSSANDTPDQRDVFIRQRGGAVLRLKDGSMISNPFAVQKIEDTGLPLQREVTDKNGIGGTVQKAFGGIQSVGIGIPVRTQDLYESVSIKDAEAVLELIIKLLY